MNDKIFKVLFTVALAVIMAMIPLFHSMNKNYIDAKFETMEEKLLTTRSRSALNNEDIDKMKEDVTEIKIKLARIEALLEDNGIHHSGP